MSFAINEDVASIRFPHAVKVQADKVRVLLQQRVNTNADSFVSLGLNLSGAQAAELAYWLMRGAMYADPKAASKWLFELEVDRLQEAA